MYDLKKPSQVIKAMKENKQNIKHLYRDPKTGLSINNTFKNLLKQDIK